MKKCESHKKHQKSNGSWCFCQVLPPLRDASLPYGSERFICSGDALRSPTPASPRPEGWKWYPHKSWGSVEQKHDSLWNLSPPALRKSSGSCASYGSYGSYCVAMLGLHYFGDHGDMVKGRPLGYLMCHSLQLGLQDKATKPAKMVVF